MRYFPTVLFALLVVLSQAVGCKKKENKPTPAPEVKTNTDPDPIIIAISYSGIPVKGQKLRFGANAPDSLDLKWDMGTGFSPVLTDSPYHVYAYTGHYTVNLLSGEKTLASKEIFIDRTTYKFGFEGKPRRWKHLSRGYDSKTSPPAFTENEDVYFEITGLNDTLSNPYTPDAIYQGTPLNSDTLHISTEHPYRIYSVYIDYATQTDNIVIKHYSNYTNHHSGITSFNENIYYTY